MLSIVIPYSHHPERLPLLKACIDALPKNVEVCVHEVGKKQALTAKFIFRSVENFRYRFTNYSGIFHRAWVLNSGVRLLSTGDLIVLLDADLILTKEWSKEIALCNSVSAAWGELCYLSQGATRSYLKTKKIPDGCISFERPDVERAAGAATIIPRDIFFKVKGLPEDFEGTWGGEDNTLFAKLIKLGYTPKQFKCRIYHMYHSHRTVKDNVIRKKLWKMLRWSRDQWEEYLEKLGDDWGRI